MSNAASSMNEEPKRLLARWAAERGLAFAAGSLENLDAAREALDRRRASGELDAAFAAQWLDGFSYLRDTGLARPRSLVVLAEPAPAYLVTFEEADRTRKLILPPTYVRYRGTFARLCEELASAVGVNGRSFEVLDAPLKSLAALLGLVRYGRNNVCTIPGLGSYFQLVGLVSELPLGDRAPEPGWEWPMLDECRRCDRCVRACTREAIPRGDRFLLIAERCVVPMTELGGELPPDLVHPYPGALVGCLKCQVVCPLNRGKLRFVDSGVRLSPAETRALLSDTPLGVDPVLEPVRARLGALGLSEDAAIYLRNARFLLGRRRG